MAKVLAVLKRKFSAATFVLVTIDKDFTLTSVNDALAAKLPPLLATCATPHYRVLLALCHLRIFKWPTATLISNFTTFLGRLTDTLGHHLAAFTLLLPSTIDLHLHEKFLAYLLPTKIDFAIFAIPAADWCAQKSLQEHANFVIHKFLTIRHLYSIAAAYPDFYKQNEPNFISVVRHYDSDDTPRPTVLKYIKPYLYKLAALPPFRTQLCALCRQVTSTSVGPYSPQRYGLHTLCRTPGSVLPASLSASASSIADPSAKILPFALAHYQRSPSETAPSPLPAGRFPDPVPWMPVIRLSRPTPPQAVLGGPAPPSPPNAALLTPEFLPPLPRVPAPPLRCTVTLDNTSLPLPASRKRPLLPEARALLLRATNAPTFTLIDAIDGAPPFRAALRHGAAQLVARRACPVSDDPVLIPGADVAPAFAVQPPESPALAARRLNAEAQTQSALASAAWRAYAVALAAAPAPPPPRTPPASPPPPPSDQPLDLSLPPYAPL